MIGEQKALMSRLGTASAEEKEIMARLRKLGEDMKAPTPGPAPPAEYRGVTGEVSQTQGRGTSMCF